jgi:hypothetical protein
MSKKIELDIAGVLKQLGMNPDKYGTWMVKESNPSPRTVIENVQPSQKQ